MGPKDVKKMLKALDDIAKALQQIQKDIAQIRAEAHTEALAKTMRKP